LIKSGDRFLATDLWIIPTVNAGCLTLNTGAEEPLGWSALNTTGARIIIG